jgi:hypothetical protein
LRELRLQYLVRARDGDRVRARHRRTHRAGNGG